jgi:Ser/Thr protein kinase RdoA (MazF antagonist)
MSDTRESIREVLQRFDGLGDAEHISRIRQGHSNAAWKVTSAGHSALVKVHVGYHHRNQVLHEIELLDDLRQRDLPFRIPLYLPDREGHRVITVGEVVYSVQEFYEGTPVDPLAMDQVEAAGHALGDLHASMIQVRSVRPWPVGRRSHLVPDMATTRVWPGSLATGLSDRTREGIVWLDRTFVELRHDLDPHLVLVPRQLIHGDYVPGNLLWDQRGISAILDFEFAAVRSRVLDVAMALLHFVRYWTSQDSLRTITVFVDGYSASGGLTEWERSLLVPLMRAQNLSSTVWWIDLALERNLDRRDIDLRLDRTDELDRWIVEYATDIETSVHGDS